MRDRPGDDTDENALVADLRRGDANAFDIAYSHYRPRLFGFLLRLGGDRQLAEDLLSETWLRLARYARTLRADTNLRAWLFAVARNLFLSHRRWLAVDEERRERLSDEREDSPPTPHETATANERGRRLEAAILALPEKYRAVVLLVGVEAMTPSEAAEVLGQTPEATRKQLSRARAMLREELDDEEQ